MPRSRSSVKKASKVHGKVRKVQQNKKKIRKNLAPGLLPETRKAWDGKKTMRDNYAAMGLASKINEDAAVAVEVQTSSAKLNGKRTSSLALGTGQLQKVEGGLKLQTEERPVSELAQLVENEMQEVASSAAPARKFMFEGEQEFVESLLKKYDKDEYAKMARDMRLNPYQHTPAQIKKKVEKYFKYTAEGRSKDRSAATMLPCHTWNVGTGKKKEYRI